MHFGSSIELYLTMLAWHLYDGIWELLSSTGLALIPFIVVIIQVLLKSAEKKNKMQDGSIILQSLEVPVYVMLFIMLIAFVPTINLHPQNMTETQIECTTDNSSSLYNEVQELKRIKTVRNFGKTDTTYDDDATLIVTIENSIPQTPLWWYFFHKISQASTLALINILPCNPDLRALRADVSYLNIDDQLLRSETSQFLRDCWRPAANKFFREQPTTSISNINDDIAWAGSRFFMSTAGYYDHFHTEESLGSFPYLYNGTKDNSRTEQNTEAFAENRGTPYCHHWWQHKEYGLRARLLDDINIYLNGRSSLSGYVDAIKARFNGNKAEMEDALLRTALNAETRLSGQQVANSYTRENQGAGLGAHSFTDKIKYLTSTVGMAMKTFGSSTESFIYSQAAPIVQSLIIMLFITMLPILMVLSMYSLETLLTLTITLFSLIFWTFLFALAYWLDNFLLGALDSGGSHANTMLGLFDGGSAAVSLEGYRGHSQALDIINWITRFMYIFLPILFTAFMGLVTKGAVGGIGNMVGDMGKNTAKGGAAGSELAQKTVTKGKF
jgi:hypothetical protein